MNSDNNIFVTKPFLPPLEDFLPYLEDIWGTRTLTNKGKFHQQCEIELAAYLGIEFISLVANATLALIIGLKELKITGEVITTPFSFAATTHSLSWNGIKPVFVDIEPEHFTLDPEKIENAITPNTTAILPVHVYGYPCNITKIQEIADKYGLQVIYDAAHAFGVKVDNRSVLEFGDLSVLSFHATKIYTTFEGGAIISHDNKTKERIDYLKNHGFTGETTVIAPGINAKMNEFQAALGLLQLKYIEQVKSRRKEITEFYWKNLSEIPGIKASTEKSGTTYNYSYFPIQVDKQGYGLNRDELYDKLKACGIFTRRYFFPLISNFPCYNSLPSAHKSNLPIANDIAEKILCLPIYPMLSVSDQQKIIDIIKG